MAAISLTGRCWTNLPHIRSHCATCDASRSSQKSFRAGCGIRRPYLRRKEPAAEGVAAGSRDRLPRGRQPGVGFQYRRSGKALQPLCDPAVAPRPPLSMASADMNANTRLP